MTDRTDRPGRGRPRIARAGLVGALALVAACGTAGDGFDYDRAHADPFAYPFPTEGLGRARPWPLAATDPGAVAGAGSGARDDGG
ncbi:MAG: hypothetical protein RQ752_13140, partial [Thermohalobaculum sp.]|nr:hypothetical protein [Thermohalobaculum sp.]